MIISASRRTDIPASYSAWFMNRLRAGYCVVPNPFYPSQVYRVSMLPEDVDVIVFWSKNPAPLIPHLPELDARGYRYYFHYTLNDYPAALETNVRSLDHRLETFHHLSDRLGPDRVIWRYDPILLSNKTDADYHRDCFARLATNLRGATRRVMVSFCSFYRKTERRLGALEAEGYSFQKVDAASPGAADLVRDLAATAAANGIEMFACADEHDLTELGIGRGRCIDPALIQRLWSMPLNVTKDPGQRPHCGCAVSKDIGVNDTCLHGCRYCYATVSRRLALRRYAEHDPHAEALWGHPETLLESVGSGG